MHQTEESRKFTPALFARKMECAGNGNREPRAMQLVNCEYPHCLFSSLVFVSSAEISHIFSQLPIARYVYVHGDRVVSFMRRAFKNSGEPRRIITVSVWLGLIFVKTYSFHTPHCGRQAGFVRGFLCALCRVGSCCVCSELLHANGIL